MWDTDTGRELVTLTGARGLATYGAFSPDGRRIVFGYGDGTLRMYEAETGHEVLALKGGTDSIMGIRFSTVGRRMVTVSLDGAVKVWKTDFAVHAD